MFKCHVVLQPKALRVKGMMESTLPLWWGCGMITLLSFIMFNIIRPHEKTIY